MHERRLSNKEILAIGFMTFALFVGAGNIIVPPMEGLRAGSNMWLAAIGFLLSGVGLPLLAMVALARTGGSLDDLAKPLGKTGSFILSIACYLAAACFASPRTATVSYQLGIEPFLSTINDSNGLLIYSAIYFAAVISLAMYPGKLVDTVGSLLAPVMILLLLILSFAAFTWTEGSVLAPSDSYKEHALTTGFLNGYLTMDVIGAMLFGIVVIKAIQERGITSNTKVSKYMILASLIAGIGMAAIYIGLFKVGAANGSLAPDSKTGSEVLSLYVAGVFKTYGKLLLSFIIVLACLSTAVGLVSSCAHFFSKITGKSYKMLLVVFAFIGVLISSLGVETILNIMLPVMTSVYPVLIALSVLRFTDNCWKNNIRVYRPVCIVAFISGFINALAISTPLKSTYLQVLSSSSIVNLIWLPPTILTFIVAATVDRLMGDPEFKTFTGK